MPYSGAPGEPIMFDGESSDTVKPKRKKSPKAPRAPKAKPPCKYGPRGADGRCPKKPRTTATSTERAIAKAIGVKVPRASGRTTVAEKIAVAAGGRAAALGGRRLAGKLSGATLEAFLSGGVFSGGAAMVAARLSVVAAAGLAAYAATSAILNKIRDAKERKAQQRFELAQAYRQTRLDLAASAGRPLTAVEQSILSTKFKQAAHDIGWEI